MDKVPQNTSATGSLNGSSNNAPGHALPNGSASYSHVGSHLTEESARRYALSAGPAGTLNLSHTDMHGTRNITGGSSRVPISNARCNLHHLGAVNQRLHPQHVMNPHHLAGSHGRHSYNQARAQQHISHRAPIDQAQRSQSWSVPNPLTSKGTTVNALSSNPHRQNPHMQNALAQNPLMQNRGGQHPNANMNGTVSRSIVNGPVSRPTVNGPLISRPMVVRQPHHQPVISSQMKKPKIVLSVESKQALSKVIWYAIRSKDGTVAPELMMAAEATGLPRHAIVKATRVAREREASKRKNAAQQHRIKMTEQANSAIKIKTPEDVKRAYLHHPPTPTLVTKPPPPLTNEMKATLEERSRWKRAYSGVFSMQKGRLVALPHSVGAVVRSSNLEPAVKGRKRVLSGTLRAEAAAIQKKLLEAQRQESRQTLNSPFLALLDQEKFKRVKIEPKKHAKALDRAARKGRQSVADTLIKQHKELSKSIISHQLEFYKFHRNRKSEVSRLAKSVRDTFDKEEKKKQKDAVQAERARLAALKSNDMTAYSQLLEETKNERLKFLLDKTEQSFTQISSLLQKRSTDEGNASLVQPDTSSYYSSAHLKTEEVRQPSIMVGGDLKEYQLSGLQWMVSLYNNKLNGILADEMGLGKTIQAISLLAYLMEYKQNLGPYLVIVPLSTLSNWSNEFAKWCPSARLVCYKGTPNQRKELYKDQVQSGHFNVLLTTYEYIIKDKKYLRKLIWQYAIVDEGHRMKNAQSKFAVTLGTQYTTKFRILLTGTPLMNDLSELWSLLNFLLPSVFNSVETFDQWFSRPFSQFSGSKNEEEESDEMLSNEERMLIIHRLHELLRPFMLRRVKSEVLDQLPEKVEKVLWCDLSSWQRELYKQISAKVINAGEQPQAPVRGLNNVVMQLRKVCNHPYLFNPEGYHINDVIIRSSGKVELLDQMLPKLKAGGHRVLLFTQMTAVMTILEDYFTYRGFMSLRLDGSTPAEERERRMYKFNAPDSPYFIFLLSTRAGGLGLNLTSADTVIIFDSDWNPMMDLQAQDRAHRIGQRSNVSVFRLMTRSPVEEKILSRATEKLNISQLVVEAGKFNKRSVESDNSLERKQIMEVLLTDFSTPANQPKASTENSGSEGDDVENDSVASEKEDLNELFSNVECDYDLYSSIDKQLARDGVEPTTLFTKLEDIPDWIKYPNGPKNNVQSDSNDVARQRKSVAYDDGLTEKQFMRMVEKQADDEETAITKRRAKNRVKNNTNVVQVIEDEDPVEDLPKEEIGIDDSRLTDWTFRKLISCTKQVLALKEPTSKRRYSEIFIEKPSPQTFPDYYELIDKPIAINDILRKCRGKIYGSMQEFRNDWKLMFANAVIFNGVDSWVVEDSKCLDKELERVLKKNGFDEEKPMPTTIKKKKKLRIKLSLKALKAKPEEESEEHTGEISEQLRKKSRKRKKIR